MRRILFLLLLSACARPQAEAGCPLYCAAETSEQVKACIERHELIHYDTRRNKCIPKIALYSPECAECHEMPQLQAFEAECD